MQPTTTTQSSKSRDVYIGGPGTILPMWMESTMVWIFAVLCLSVSFFHYCRQQLGIRWMIIRSRQSLGSTTVDNRCWLHAVPLCTHSRREIHSVSPMERYQQLTQYLLLQLQPTNNGVALTYFSKEDDAVLIQRIQTDPIARRLASLLMIHRSHLDPVFNDTQLSLWTQLKRIWPHLLSLPTTTTTPITEYPFDISVIVPAFREDGNVLLDKLQLAFQQRTLRQTMTTIEWIVVDAGHCSHMDRIMDISRKSGDRGVKSTASSNSNQPFQGTLRYLPCQIAAAADGDGTSGRGRGPCLNRGAKAARGRILTFLHADTRLSPGWDQAILQACTPSTTTVNACAFSFAIDRTTTTTYLPPGLQAIETTANLRTHWFHLPYGDQCLSVPRKVFDHVGGFPYQCLMEDYELIQVLRQRVAFLGEELAILPLPAYCSPRRWQTFGALYVTWTNSKLVNLYTSSTTASTRKGNGGRVSPDELYELYYGSDTSTTTATTTGAVRASPLSPWEKELRQHLLSLSLAS